MARFAFLAFPRKNPDAGDAGREKTSPSRGRFFLLWGLVLLGLAGAGLWQYGFKAPVKEHSPVVAAVLQPRPYPLINGVNPDDLALPPAPISGMTEKTPEGDLPRLAPDGRASFDVYAAPFDKTDTRPRVGVVLYDIGLADSNLLDSIQRLPGYVGLAFNIYTPHLAEALARSRTAGHEVLLTIPAQSSTEGAWDPGPNGLLRRLPLEDNMQRLRLIMGKATGYIGLVSDPDTAAMEDPSLNESILDELRHRGVALLTSAPALRKKADALSAPVIFASLTLDPFVTADERAATLRKAEELAKSEKNGVLVLAPAYPNVVSLLAQWLPLLSGQGIALAPASAFVSLSALPSSALPAPPP